MNMENSVSFDTQNTTNKNKPTETSNSSSRTTSGTMLAGKNTVTDTKDTENVPQCVKEAVFVQSVRLPAETPVVKGYNWDEGLDYSKLLQSFLTTGIQATNFGLAVKEINEMISRRNEEYVEPDYMKLEEDEFIRPKKNLTIFLGYTSNMVTSGVRETIRFLVKNKMVDCLVTSAGGVEEDFVKCLAPSYVGNFYLDDKKLRDQGLNRAGNILIPNENYGLFQEWINPILDKMVEEQKTKNTLWTPSKIITRLGEEINNEESIFYWAAINKIPVFCPAITDGSFGDMVFCHFFSNPVFIIDIVRDVIRLNTIALRAKNTGMIILGGSVPKHQICNANLMRNGADFSVFINTATDQDGSDSGARPEEAVSWGKIRKTATPVKIFGDASILFPLLVAETFAKEAFKK